MHIIEHIIEGVILFPLMLYTLIVSWSQINLIYLWYLFLNFDLSKDDWDSFEQESSNIFMFHYKMYIREEHDGNFFKFVSLRNKSFWYYGFYFFVSLLYLGAGLGLIEHLSIKYLKLTIIIIAISLLIIVHSIPPLFRLRNGKLKIK